MYVYRSTLSHRDCQQKSWVFLGHLLCCGNTIFFLREDVSLNYSAVLETILSGHEGWVYSLSWHPKILQGTSYMNYMLRFLSY